MLKDEWFLKTLRDDWELNITYLEGLGGNWGTSEFFNVTSLKKLEYLIQIIKDNWNNIIIWSDVDIQFFGKCEDIVLKSLDGKDITFQAEWVGKDAVNVGFFAMRCNEKTLSLWDYVLRCSKNNIQDLGNKKFPFGDQTVMNMALRENTINVKWCLLPESIWARSNGWEPPIDIVLHHANCAGSIEKKLQQMEYIRKIVTSPLRLRFANCKRKAKIMAKKLFSNREKQYV